MEKIKNAPNDPGCYIYKNNVEKIIYIGKARNIQKRVSSYFVHTGKDVKTSKLIQHISDVEFIITHSEIDALILENNLIKEHKPKYNILLRDDKTFPYVKISNEYFPRVLITRKFENDGGKYFGPFTESRRLKHTIELIKRIFPVRRCNRSFNAGNIGPEKQKVCLNYHINRCEAPCVKYVSYQHYMEMVQKIEDFLNGKTAEVIDYFQKRMKEAAMSQKYEFAAKYRDNIKLVNNLYRRQIVEDTTLEDRDLFNISVEENKACAVLMKIRQGKLLGQEVFFMDWSGNQAEESILENFIQNYYSNTTNFPNEIIVENLPTDRELLQDWLKEISGKIVKIIKAVRKDKTRLLSMAKKNAGLRLREFILKEKKIYNYIPLTLSSLRESLNLNSLPKKIEGFDISNISGTHKVASMVCFVNASAKKSEYRKFSIKTVDGINDFASMAEVIKRRYTRVLKENLEKPDLILIDGGKGQLSVAKAVLNNLGLGSIPIIGLAKKLEEIFIPGESEPIVLAKDNPGLTLLRRIRDESHRFAITYHRKKRSKASVKSILDDIPGLGENKKLALINHFKSVERIKALSIEDLCDVKGIGLKLAKNIWVCIHER
ncbi:MAG: excinuclease ABC subunit UvrC [Candidatus Marinimicrobia bacterium]|nr:excinuclease ABC subunit UvrC [Candidatus Neomarinimicrobiota bacterium]